MYFLMSKRFNKTKPSDFELIATKDQEIYYREFDKTYWKKMLSIDLGWGQEVGFYRIPKQNFEQLIQLMFYSKDEDDFYGSIAVLLNDYPTEFLLQLESINLVNLDKERVKKIIDTIANQLIFSPEYIRNQNPLITKELPRWKKIVSR